MKLSFDLALKLVLEHEGGYTNEKTDPGGPTNWGITIYDARAYWKHDATAFDVKSMPLEVAKDIYHAKYWDALECDDLPAGVDYAVFDYGINSGVSRAAKVLQALVGAQTDGHVGPKTIKATSETESLALIKEICDERLEFLKRLHNWPTYKKGWTRRVSEVQHTALMLAEDAAKPIASAEKGGD